MRSLSFSFSALVLALLGCSSAGTTPTTHEGSALAATDYDRTCKVDDDCMLILQGDRCDCECPAAAIAKTAASQYEADRASLPACSTATCDLECKPRPLAACVAGYCERRLVKEP